MPTFTQVSVSITDDNDEPQEHEVDVDFEVFCGECGAGICDHASTRKSHGRRLPQISMALCYKCKANFEGEIEDRDQTIRGLEQEVDDLKSQLADAQEARAE